MYARATVTASFLLVTFAGAAQAQSGPEALAAAITKRQPDAVAALIAQGADVNAAYEGMTPLYRAAMVRPPQPGIVQLLLTRGADVTALSDDRELPLRVAHAFGNSRGIYETYEALMARSSGPAARTAERLSPLHVASSPEVIRLLLERGARVDARDVAGNTPLFWAAVRYDQNAADALLQHGADINARNSGGLTPLDAVTPFQRSMLEAHLRARGARPGAGLASTDLSDVDLRRRLEAARSPLTAFVISRRNDEEALRKIVAWQDTRLLHAYVSGAYTDGSKFRMSREKLELLYPTLKQSWPSDHAKEGAVRLISGSGLPAIEQTLLEVLPFVPERSQREIEERLAERRFEPAVSYIAERLSDPDSTRCTNLARIGSTAAAAEMVRCLARLTELRRGGHDEVLYALSKHGGIPEVDFVALRKALPPAMNEKTTARYFELVGLYQPASEVPLLLAAMRDNPPASWIGSAARGALARFRSEEVQKQVLAELGQLAAAGKIDPASRQFVVQGYAESNRLPTQHQAAIQGHTANHFARDREQLDRVKRSAEVYRETQPDRYAQEYDAYLTQVATLAEKYRSDVYFDGLRAEVEQGYRMLGDFTRFKLRHPSQAVDYYTKAAALSAAKRGYGYLSDLVAGDLFQFDLKDRGKALAAYRRAAERLRASPTGRNDWLAGALAHEISYLEGGKPFTGPIGAAELQQFLATVLLAANGAFGDPGIGIVLLQRSSISPAERKEFEQRLEQLTPSHLNFLKVVPLLSLVSAEPTVSRFLKKHDPGGYWSASLALIVLHPELLKEAGTAALFPGITADAPLVASAKKLVKERGVSLGAGVRAPDARRSTPERTWRLLMDSLRSGDTDTALACFTPAMQSKLEPLFRSMAPSAMQEMADSFTSFSLQAGSSEVREAFLTRRAGNQPQQAGFAYFVRHAGEWKIDQM